MWLPYLAALLGSIVSSAWAQGGITLRNRLYVPPSEQAAINADLHYLLPVEYVMLCIIIARHTGWHWLAIGLLLRVALFDAMLNYRKGDAPFSVGHSGRLDRLLTPARSAVLRLAALAAAVALLLL